MKIPLLVSGGIHLTLIGVFVLVSKPTYISPNARPAMDVRWVNLVLPPKTAKPSTAETVAPPPPAAPVNIATKTVKAKEKPPQTAPPVESPVSQPTEPTLTPTGIARIGEVVVDNPNFKFIYYLNLVRYKVQENWQPPLTKAQPDLKAMVRFSIARSGTLGQTILEQPSGNFLFDQSAQRAVQALKRLPPLPEEFEEEELVVHLEFEGLP